MSATKRRAFLAGISSLLTLPLLGKAKASATGRQAGTDTTLRPRLIALTAVRFINTIENNHFRFRGHYLRLAALWDSDIRPFCYPEDWRMRSYLSFAPDTDFVPGFRATLRLAEDGSGYVAMVVETATQFAYWSDQNGVIFKGTAIDENGRPSLDPGDFNGVPISAIHDAGQPRSLVQRLRAVLMFTMGLIVPTLYAEDPCCQPGGCSCNQSSCVCGLLICCNTGMQGGCLQCCSSYECPTCVPDGCTGMPELVT